MFDTAAQLMAAFGLAGAAGLNAWLPLLVVGLMARYTQMLTLSPPFDNLAHPIVLGVMGVLLVVEIFADKVPALDSANDVIHSIIRPAAGAILVAAQGGAITDMHPAFALVLGLLVAGSVHSVKALARPAVNVSSMGTLGPVVSIIEDVVSLAVSILAVIAPLLGVLLLVAALLPAIWVLLFFRDRLRRGTKHGDA